MVVNQGFEPPQMTGCFLGWDDEVFAVSRKIYIFFFFEITFRYVTGNVSFKNNCSKHFENSQVNNCSVNFCEIFTHSRYFNHSL